MRTIRELWKMVQDADATTAELIPFFGQQAFWVMTAAVTAVGIFLFL